MNKITLIGNVGKDPEERVTPSGMKMVNFSIADNQRQKGEELTQWFNVTLWDVSRFERILPYVKKGSLIMVTGTLKPPRTYQSATGETRVSLDVTCEGIDFLPGRKESQEGGMGAPQANASSPFAVPQQSAQPTQDFGTTGQAQGAPIQEDDLPF